MQERENTLHLLLEEMKSITQDVFNATTNLININDLLMERNEFSNVMRDVDPFQ
jgi:hypothetical protein